MGLWVGGGRLILAFGGCGWRCKTGCGCCQVDSGSLTQPLWDTATLGATAYPNNMEFVRDYSIKLLGTSFPNMTPLEARHKFFLEKLLVFAVRVVVFHVITALFCDLLWI